MLQSSAASCYIKRKKINNEGVDFDGFQSSSLITAWEVFPCALSQRR